MAAAAAVFEAVATARMMRWHREQMTMVPLEESLPTWLEQQQREHRQSQVGTMAPHLPAATLAASAHSWLLGEQDRSQADDAELGHPAAEQQHAAVRTVLRSH